MFTLRLLALALIAFTTIEASPLSQNIENYAGSLTINGTVTGASELSKLADSDLCCCNIPGCGHLCGCTCGSACYSNGYTCWCYAL
ncbi:hypothetical protein HA402_002733 [Bradysia odoriphaga]|nr:hypothetical protein HA402_002733 [Bradysia odoriphaga]